MIGKQLPLIVDTVDLALDLSIEHYTRICRATKKELQNASPWLLYGTLCGLCEYKRQHAISCADCVLGKKYGRCAEEHKENPWYVTKTKFDNLQDGRCSLRSFRKYVKKMLIILIQIKKGAIMHGFGSQIVDYVINGHCTGSFKYALMSGNLFAAVQHADSNNRLQIVQFVEWVYNNCPPACYGSEEKVKDWGKKGGLMGLGGQETVDQWKLMHSIS